MAKNIVDIRNEIREAKLDMSLLQKIDCSPEENQAYLKLVNSGQALPQGVYRYEDEGGMVLNRFYTIYDPQLTEVETAEYIALMQYQELKTIRQYVFFFVVLAIVGIMAGLILGIILASAG